jgi:hypothetical protein
MSITIRLTYMVTTWGPETAHKLGACSSRFPGFSRFFEVWQGRGGGASLALCAILEPSMDEYRVYGYG